MRRNVKLTVVLLSIWLAASAYGQAPVANSLPTPGQLAAMSDEALVSKIKSIESDVTSRPDWCTMTAYSAEVARRQPVQQNLAIAAFAAGNCDFVNEQFANAIANLTRAEQLFGSETSLAKRAYMDSTILIAAARSNDNGAFATHIKHIADRDWPDEYARANPGLWLYGMQIAGEREAERIAFAFARSKSFGALPEEVRSLIAPRAVRPAIAAGQTDLALSMAIAFPDPENVRRMLIDRDFEVLWPQLDNAAGPRLKPLRKAAVDYARQRFDADNENRELRAALADALLKNGDYAEVLKLTDAVDTSPGADRSYSLDDGWLLNYRATALDALGRRTEADAAMDRVGLLSSAGNRGWVVNFAINRAFRLVDQGRWREALPAAELAMQVAQDNGSAFAKQIAGTARYCAAVKLDPTAARLKEDWAAIVAFAKDSIGSSVVAALCAGNLEAARAFLRDGLEDPDTRSTALGLVQPEGYALVLPFKSAVPDPSILLTQDPNLRAVFQKYGRQLPAHLLPN